jgi:hypothetical protein
MAKGCWNHSIQGTHLHLIVEAEGKDSLARGMKGLEVRVARALNRMMVRRGSAEKQQRRAESGCS